MADCECTTELLDVLEGKLSTIYSFVLCSNKVHPASSLSNFESKFASFSLQIKSGQMNTTKFCEETSNFLDLSLGRFDKVS